MTIKGVLVIILDTCVLRGSGLNDGSTDLLRALRHTGAHSVAVPWMVLEELAAQKTIPYVEKHERALEAAKALQEATPWIAMGGPPPREAGRVRAHWRDVFREIVEVIPTSDEVLREAAFREANKLAPCGVKKSMKTGFRDAAIWLSAVEYAREHPEETVYFVSGNTTDFGEGDEYPHAMWKDIEAFEERFVHLTDLADVLSRHTEPAQVDEDSVRAALASEGSREVVTKRAKALARSSQLDGYIGTMETGELTLATSVDLITDVRLRAFDDVETYRIGEGEWCTATARWLMLAYSAVRPVAFVWETRVLASLDSESPRLSVLRTIDVHPPVEEDFDAVPRTHWVSPQDNPSLSAGERNAILAFSNQEGLQSTANALVAVAQAMGKMYHGQSGSK